MVSSAVIVGACNPGDCLRVVWNSSMPCMVVVVGHCCVRGMVGRILLHRMRRPAPLRGCIPSTSCGHGATVFTVHAAVKRPYFARLHQDLSRLCGALCLSVPPGLFVLPAVKRKTYVNKNSCLHTVPHVFCSFQSLGYSPACLPFVTLDTPPEFYADGDCDPSNNNAECGYDAGDCCSCTCVVRLDLKLHRLYCEACFYADYTLI